MTCIRRARTYWTTCPCPDCVIDRSRTRKLHSVGIVHRYPQDLAWATLVAKFDAGWTARAIGSATGLGADYFTRHAAQYRKGNVVLIGPAAATAIMHMGIPTEGQVGAEPSRRRLRALAVIGHGLNSLAVETGVNFSTLAAIRSGRTTRIGARIAVRVADVYDRLHMTPGNDGQALRIAREKAWPSPLAFDDIDDLDETPDIDRAPVDRREQFTELVHMGAGISEVCRRLDLSRQSLEKWAERNGMRPEFNQLSARETVPREWRNQHTAGGAA